ncbi:MAG: helix-turn-helix domain-containing protein [Neomegalonema sp.]|nr:helix-turn-helix domain-containing protein [Neomegalonema sp.]
MRSSDLPEIRQLALFRDMSDESFADLVRGGYVQTFPPQVELIREGDASDFLHVIIDGVVELIAGWNERQTVMAMVRPISTFILAATIKDAPYLMSARTVEKSRIVMLPSEDVRAVFDRDHAFARAVVTELAVCYRSVVKNSKGLKLRTSVERLANYLLRQGLHEEDRRRFALIVEKRRLASYLGMTPENLSRAIKTLEPYGVTIDGADVFVRDLSNLERFAKPTPLIDDPSC